MTFTAAINLTIRYSSGAQEKCIRNPTLAVKDSHRKKLKHNQNKPRTPIIINFNLDLHGKPLITCIKREERSGIPLQG
jgi:hypothetical protein